MRPAHGDAAADVRLLCCIPRGHLALSADFDKAAPESMKDYAPTVGDAFLILGSHWLMHAGQWAVLRRKLGKPPLF